jgi:hypothetical protein
VGTSADRSAGRGGNWTPLKVATNSYVRSIGRTESGDRARRVLARHVPLLGGSSGAVSSARAGSTGIRRLGAFLSGVGASGVESTLQSLGLSQLVGRDRFVVLDELVTFIAGDGDDLDAQAARDAACDVLEDIFGDADAWEEIAAVGVSEDELADILERFLALYIYNRIPVVAERLSRLSDPVAMRRADQEMRQIIADLVAIQLPDDPLSVDWQGSEGRAIAQSAIESVYETLSALEDQEQS